MPATRATLLRQLIEYRLPIDATIGELSTYGWDSEEPHVRLEARDIEGVLQRYLSGELSAAQVTDWADLIECREDIDSGQSESTLSSLIFRLANPNLNVEVTPSVAREMLALLGERDGHNQAS
jgi:hypothetical protein